MICAVWATIKSEFEEHFKKQESQIAEQEKQIMILKNDVEVKDKIIEHIKDQLEILTNKIDLKEIKGQNIKEFKESIKVPCRIRPRMEI